MGITILGNVGKIIEDNHGEMYFDNAKKIGFAEQKQTREVEDIVPVCPAEVETANSEPASLTLLRSSSNPTSRIDWLWSRY